MLTEDDLRSLVPDELVFAHRARSLSPDRPVLRGTAQNPDVYFQARETVNSYYTACLDITEQVMNEFAQLTGRQYKLYEYYGDPTAERIVILMGSGCESVHETVDHLNAKGEKLGVVKVRMYRPFDGKRLMAAIPETVKSIAVLDRTKEPGAGGEPLYLDVITALVEQERTTIKVVGGRYGLSSKEFTPSMIKAVFDNLSAAKPRIILQ
jgi:Pyruvate:ferredoxin oxidoreductase and related 2-oxoacid:ferredoxin oxidoreductases, alpha subunit